MQTNKVIIILAAVLILFCIVITFAAGLGIGFGLSNEIKPAMFNQRDATATEPGAYEPPQRPAQRGQLLLEDDFSREQWNVHSDSEHRQGYADGRYFILIDVQEYNYWSMAGETFQDFVMEVETIQVDGPDSNDYGVILRYQDEANFYSFEISGDGYYTFSKLVDDELFDVIPWQESSAINQGNSHNALRVEAVGPNFTFYINNELVDVAIDPDFSQGDVGLLAGTYQEPGAHIAFDNLRVWAVE
jgi:hypothetical protein